MSWKIQRELFPLGIIVLVCVLSAIFYPRLPESIPSHFDAKGIADDYSPKLDFMLIMIGIVVGTYLLLTFIPFIDPLWKTIQSKYHILLVFRDFALVSVLYIYILAIIAAKEGKLRVHLLGIGFGLLFLLLGYYLPKLPRNWFFGIRVPWTLASDIVWERTHALGGRLFMAAGLVIVVLSLLEVDLVRALLITLIPTLLIVGLVYPLLLFRRLQREGKLDHAGK